MWWALVFLLLPIQAFAESPSPAPFPHRDAYSLAFEGRFQEALDAVKKRTKPWAPPGIIYEGESPTVAWSIIYSIANDPKTAFAQTQSLYNSPPFQKTLTCSAKWIDYCDHDSNDPESTRYEKCDKDAWRQKDGDACYESMFGTDYLFVNRHETLRTVSFANALAYYQLGDLENAYAHINTARKLSHRTYDLRSYLLTTIIYEALNRPVPYGLPPNLDIAIQHLEKNSKNWPDREKHRFQMWSRYFLSIRRPPSIARPPMTSAHLPEATVAQDDKVSELIRNYVLGEAERARKEQDQRERYIEKQVLNSAKTSLEE
jgi:tetratricopeptide (TPR) repeat protein